MSHEITRTNGKDEMAYTGEKPWHGLGQELRLGAPLEEWQRAAGMDWKVQRSKVRYFADKNGTSQMEWPEQHVLFRSDNHKPLGIVSDHYKTVQPATVLEFFRDLASSNRFTLDTAGTLKGGAIYWALAKIHESAEVGPGDEMRGYVLLSTSADGTRATTAKNCAERVVCWNTLQIADSESGKAEVVVNHRSVFDADAVKADLGLAHGAFESFMVQAREMAKRPIGGREPIAFVLALLGGYDTAVAMEQARKIENGTENEHTIEVLSSKHAQGIAALYAGAAQGAHLPSAKNTAWGMVNAVTEYVDHYYPARSDENRLANAWFSNGARLKSKAYAQALELVSA